MHITCQQTAFSQALSVVSRAISARTTLPILANVRIGTSNGDLELSATNLEIGITYRMACEVMEPGVITLPAKVLNEFISGLPAGLVEMIVPEDSTEAQIIGLRSRATIKGMDAAEFPQMPIGEAEMPVRLESVRLESEGLKQAIVSVAFAAAHDDSRPVLTGVLIQRGERGQLSFAAADAFRLAVRTISLPDLQEEALTSGVLVPARTLTELARVLSDNGHVEMIVTSRRNQVLFSTPSLRLVSRLIDGTFPNFRAIIPADPHMRAVLETKAFAAAVKSAAFFARESSNILNVRIMPGSDAPGGLGNGCVQLEAMAEDFGESVSRLDAAAVTGTNEQRIILNVKYLAEALSHIDAPEVALEVTSATKPAVLRPVGTDGDHCIVIMPIHVNR